MRNELLGPAWNRTGPLWVISHAQVTRAIEQVKDFSCGLFSCHTGQYRQRLSVLISGWMVVVWFFFFTARSGTCAEESASPQKWPPSHWSPSGWPPEGRILRGHSSGKNKQHWNVSQVWRWEYGRSARLCVYTPPGLFRRAWRLSGCSSSVWRFSAWPLSGWFLSSDFPPCRRLWGWHLEPHTHFNMPATTTIPLNASQEKHDQWLHPPDWLWLQQDLQNYSLSEKLLLHWCTASSHPEG